MESTNDIALNTEGISGFLEKYFAYYRTLGPEWKMVFVKRVEIFAKSKWFISQKGFQINNQVKAIISASAVQLTLGLKKWKIDYFDTILLFSSDFKNEITGLKLKGETNLNGFVSFSWKSFIEGYRVPNDNLNLGLHEFTHALRFNGVRGHEPDEFFDGYFPKWLLYAKQEFNTLKNGGNSIFRKYGGTNINEFLSVVIEHFFESPIEFQTQNAGLYSATAIMLNQKTDGTTTSVNVRKDELKELSDNILLNPVEIQRGLPPLGPSLICLAVCVFTAYASGITSFPTFLTFCFFMLTFLREDFKYGSFSISDRSVCLSRGFLLFKRRPPKQIDVAQLIKAEFFENEGNSRTVSLTYFEENGDFYEDTAYVKINDGMYNSLISDLKKARVWVK